MRIKELKFEKIHLRVAALKLDLGANPLGSSSSCLQELIGIKMDVNSRSSSSQTKFELEARFQ